MIDIFNGVRLIRDEEMLRSGWMGYDKDGNCVATGKGNFSIKHSEAPVVEVRMGVTVYDYISALIAPYAADGERE